jgi:hypothetical protein
MLTDAECKNAVCTTGQKTCARFTDSGGIVPGSQPGRIEALVLENLSGDGKETTWLWAATRMFP